MDKRCLWWVVGLLLLVVRMPVMALTEPDMPPDDMEQPGENSVEINGAYYSILSEEDKTAVFDGMTPSQGDKMREEWRASGNPELCVFEIPPTVVFPDKGDEEYTVVAIGEDALGCALQNGIPQIFEHDYTLTGSSYSVISPIKIPDTIISIGAWAFPRLQQDEIIIPESVREIGSGCFRGACLSRIVLPTGLKEISVAFSSMNKHLEECEIPEGVEKIGMNAFHRCYSLKRVYIPASVKEIGYGAFTALLEIDGFEVDPANEYFCAPDGILMDKEMKILYAWPFSRTDVKVPEGIEQLTHHVLNWGFKLTSLDLPSTLHQIEEQAFCYDESLTDVYVRALTPPDCVETEPSHVINGGVFNDRVYESATLHVDGSALDAYKGHPVWGKFRSIKALPGTDAVSFTKEDSIDAIYYSTEGRPVHNPAKGEILIRRAGSHTEKIICQ